MSSDQECREFRDGYVCPAVRVVPVVMLNVFCSSPQPGGNEDVGYDDWFDNN